MAPEMQAEDFGEDYAVDHLAEEDENGKIGIKVVLLTHADGVTWAAKPGYEDLVPRILEKFDVRKMEESKFSFCGKRIYTIRRLHDTRDVQRQRTEH